ncbi:Monooxygenase [Colletotrichum sidae]|uniref:Monooxygenase n=1 Tax=Colletotrichum sidae TaxID=1347389 RepID=A0A4R8TTJ1_9PEZI|nr:Monooxygenase [Colletotrichum sidae]
MSFSGDTFQGVLKPTPRHFGYQTFDTFPLIVKDSFTLTTLFVIGALLQTLLFFTLPTKYAVIPCWILALHSVIQTVVGTVSKKSNPYIKNIIPTRVSAQLPDPLTGKIAADPASRPFVILHLGVRFNHPLGILSPGARTIADYFYGLNKQLNDRTDEYGLYHMSAWVAMGAERNNAMMNVYYFRDIEGLNKFAHDPLHRETWEWYNSIRDDYDHIGIFHEAFVTGAKEYETIYSNMQPLLLGASSVKVKNDSGEDGKKETWVNTLVRADNNLLRSQFRRMGRAAQQLASYYT